MSSSEILLQIKTFTFQGWLPGGRTNNSFMRRLVVVGTITVVSLAIALGVPGKSSDIVTATGGVPPPGSDIGYGLGVG